MVIWFLFIKFNYAQKFEIANPNGNEVFTSSTHQYVYIKNGILQYYNLYLSSDDGKSWQNIGKFIYPKYDDGEYIALEWVTPAIVSDSCLIKLERANDITSYDISDNIFSIVNGPVQKEFNFPLEVWNKWFFKSRPNYIATILTVSKDTLMDDGKKYYVIDEFSRSSNPQMPVDTTWNKNINYRLLRKEGTIIYQYPDRVILNCNWTENTGSPDFPYIQVKYAPIFGQFYLTQDMAKVLDRARQEAIKMNDEFISVEHLFLALV